MSRKCRDSFYVPCPELAWSPIIRILTSIAHLCQWRAFHGHSMATPNPQFTVVLTFNLVHPVHLCRCLVPCLHNEASTALKILPGLPIPIPIPPPSPGNHWPFHGPFLLFLFLECEIIETIQCEPFSHWLPSLSDMHLNFLHIFSWLCNSFLFCAEWYSIVWVSLSLFI